MAYDLEATDMWETIANAHSRGGYGHATRVGDIAVGLQRRLGWDHVGEGDLLIAAMVHEFGRIVEPEASLSELGPLALDVLKQTRLPEGVVDGLMDFGVLKHPDTWWDQVAPVARILTVADALDHAMVSHIEIGQRPGVAVRLAARELLRAEGDRVDPGVMLTVPRLFDSITRAWYSAAWWNSARPRRIPIE